MTPYEQGFLTKCAEYGMDADMSSAMLKQAFLWFGKSKRQTDALRKLHNEKLRKAYAEGYDEFLPKEYRAGSRNLPGSWLGRTWNRMWHGASGFAKQYEGELDRAMDQARAKYMENYRQASPEMQKLMREEVKQRRAQRDAEDMATARSKYRLGAAELDRQKAEANKPAAPATPLPVDRTAYYKQQIGDGKMRIPSITQHYYDPKTAKLYRIDGKPLHSLAAQWNERIDSGTIPAAQPQAPAPKEAPPPGPLNAPRAGY